MGHKKKLLSHLADAATSFLAEVTTDPINEIRGHFTASIFREWVKSNATGLPAAKCAASYDIDKKIVSVFLLTEDDQFIYTPAGKRVASVFSARSMDDEMRELFKSDTMALILL